MNKQAAATAQRVSEWQARLARFASSGQSIPVFCRNEAVSAWSFYHWRKRLGAGATPTQRRDKGKRSAPFIELGTMPQHVLRDAPRATTAAQPTSGTLEIRLDLGDGLVLHIARR